MSQILNISTKRQQSPNQLSPLKVFVTKYNATREAKRIIKSLKEVKDFESGKKQPKSFDNFLDEL